MRKKVIMIIVLIFVFGVIYRSYSFWQVRNVIKDFDEIIQGKEIDNVENKRHLERYLPEDNYIHTNVSCKHVLLFNKKAKMYMNLETIRIMKNENGNVITERIHDEFVMDVEKKDGVWSVERVEIVP